MRICIDDTSTGFEVRLFADERGAFDWLLSEFKGWIPKSQRRFRDGCWLIERRATRGLHQFLAAMANAGVEIVCEASAPRPEPPASDLDRLAQLYSELFLVPGAPPKLIEATGKILAVECHPDKPGGTEEKMKRVNVAADLILQIERCRQSAA